jgi:O-antigen/teichoic acid export membrane protein
MTIAGGVAGVALWLAISPLLQSLVFTELTLGLVMLASVNVFTQLMVATGKACCQGSGDLPGANRVILFEELMFLPAFGLVSVLGLHGYLGIMVGLELGQVITFTFAWRRLIVRSFFHKALKPSWTLTKRIISYGFRGQVGGAMTLLNLRLDFIIVSVVAGSATLGVYAIASKFSELLRVPGVAITYVLYPKFARDGTARATERVRELLPKVTLLMAFGFAPILLFASFLIPDIYGAKFSGAVTPSQILVGGLALQGLAGVITAFLYGVGRPGLNSLAMAAGLVMTVTLDILLIPRFGVIGAASASAVSYTTSTLTLVFFYARVKNRLKSAPIHDDLYEEDAAHSVNAV